MGIFAKRIKKARNRKGYTQHVLAGKIGVQPATISRYETGRRNSQWEVLAELAEELETSTDYLLGITDNPYPVDTIIQLETLDHNQIKFLGTYNKLSEADRQLLMERADTLYIVRNNPGPKRPR